MCLDIQGSRVLLVLPHEAIIIVHSHPFYASRRDAIRNTWGSREQCDAQGMVLRFVMSYPETIGQAYILQQEIEQYKDIIVAFGKDAHTTSQQTAYALGWMKNIECPPFKYLVQAFDFTFILLDKLGHIMKSFSDTENAYSILGLRVDSRRILPADHVMNYCPDDCFDKNPLHAWFYPSFCDLSAGFITTLPMVGQAFSKYSPAFHK